MMTQSIDACMRQQAAKWDSLMRFFVKYITLEWHTGPIY